MLKTPDPDKWQSFYLELASCLAPGKAVTACWQDMQAVMEKHNADMDSLYGIGQGIGLSPEERPRLANDAPGDLQKGMCLALHPCVQNPEVGWVMVGNTLTVTETGVEMLTA